MLEVGAWEFNMWVSSQLRERCSKLVLSGFCTDEGHRIWGVTERDVIFYKREAETSEVQLSI